MQIESLLRLTVVGLFAIGSAASALPTEVTPPRASTNTATKPFLMIADDSVRKVPKKQPKEDPPELPPSEIPGAKNPKDNYTPPSDSSGTVKNTPKEPVVKDDKCKGSSNCSTLFDGGKK